MQKPPKQGSDNGVFTIDLGTTNGTGAPILVNYSIGGTATNTTDYVTIGNSVSIPDQARTATVTIDPIDDALLESSETVVLTLSPSASYGLGAQTSAQVDLADNDSAGLTVDNATGAEGETLVFTVTLNNPTGSGAFTVAIGYTDVTATGGGAPLTSPADYLNTPKILSFNGTAGEMVSFNVPTLVDTLAEGTETFTVTMTSANSLVDTSDTGTGTITDSDTDGDGLLDGVEAGLGTDPANPDTDGDGLDDATEVGADPNNPKDEDQDGIIDALDSNTVDTDMDGVNDQQDPGNEDGCVPDPNSGACDTDGDGISDGEEITNGSDPLDPCDPDLNSPACVPGDVDLQVTKTIVNPKPANVRYEDNEEVTFHVEVTLVSPGRAMGVTIQEIIESGFQYQSHTASGNSVYDPQTGTWLIDEILPGETATLDITVLIAPGASSYTNTAALVDSFPSDGNGENNSDSVTLLVNIRNVQEAGFLYNEFSPNGDGVNDRLVVNNYEQFSPVKIQIFDRYGNSVYENDHYDNTWDGTGDNGDLPKGTYFYILDLGDGSDVRKGWIQIIR